MKLLAVIFCLQKNINTKNLYIEHIFVLSVVITYLVYVVFIVTIMY